MPDTPLATGSTHAPEEVRRFPCKQCGAGLAFNPEQAALTCPYCGYQEAIPRGEEAIREYCLEEALLHVPHTEGWGEDRRAVHCEQCGATTTFEAGQVAGECAFCGSQKVVSQEASTRLIRPESVAPFRISQAEARDLFQKWISRLWFRPNDLKHAGRLARLRGAYLPFWTYDAFTSSYWTADAGYYYYVTETYRTRDANGNWVTQTRQVRKVRWVPASGARQDFFDDELVCASTGLPPGLIEGICPFDLGRLVPYDPAYLAGFTAEEYQVDLAQGWGIARGRIQAEVNARCARDVPGDTHRNLRVNTAFSQMKYKHLLLPVWVAAYLYHDKSYRFLVNGQTGKTTGQAPISWWKVAGLVVVLLLLGLLIWWLAEGRTQVGALAPLVLPALLACFGAAPGGSALPGPKPGGLRDRLRLRRSR